LVRVPGRQWEAPVAERIDDSASEAVLPLVEEALRVGKRRVETGRVRVSVRTEAEERIVRETLRSERAELERVPIGRELAEGEPAPALRQEPDGTVVLPVLEEILVVERRLVLREEIRMRLVAVDEAVEQPMTVRRQRASVERLPPLAAGDGPGNNDR
jgi:stress response protein YsnF